MRLPACALALAAAFLLIPSAVALATTVEVQIAGTGPGVPHGEVLGTEASGELGTLIDCEGPPTTAVKPYECSSTKFVNFGPGVLAELTATPAAGSAFAGWSNATGSATMCEGSANPVCEFRPAETDSAITATFEVKLPSPNVTIEPPSGVSAHEATFHGTVNPNGNEAKWRFEYRPVGASTWSRAPVPDGDAGSGGTAQPVQATVKELEPRTGYEVRLFAYLVAQPNSTAASPVATFSTAPFPAEVVTGSAWSLSDTTATLAGTVNPNGAEVSECRFEYGPTTSYGHSARCAIAPGAGRVPVQVTADVEGLSPAATYHFRLVAANSCPEPGCGSNTGQDAAFTMRTEAESLLPQRGFELVSALETNGAPAIQVESSADGERFAYNTSIQPIPGAETGTSVFRASRNTDGSWSQQYVGPPHAAPESGTAGIDTPLFSSADLSVALDTSEGINPDDQNSTSLVNGEDVYRRNEDGSFSWVSRDPRIPAGTPQTNAENVDELDYVSSGGREVVFGSRRALLEGAPEGNSKDGLYQWREGALSLVSQVPRAGEAFCGGVAGPACGPAAGTLGSLSLSFKGDHGLAELAYQNTTNAVSRDGSRVVFQPEAGEAEKSLYVRVNGEETLDASAPGPGATTPLTACKVIGGNPANPCDVNFWGADENDEQVFFTSSSPLTGNSTAPNTGEGPADLYRWSLPAGGQPSQAKLLDLTPVKGGAGVVDVLDVSAGGLRVYFVAGAALEGTAATESGECKGGGHEGELQGTCNIYLAELGGPEATTVHLTYITSASISIGEVPSQQGRNLAISPDGRWLAFRSADALVPRRQTGGFPQVYVYDAARGELACASCTPDGTPSPTSLAVITQSSFNESGYPNSGETPPDRSKLARHVRSIASDGTVFFQTVTALVPQDTDGKEDVYAWHGGRTALISSGEGSGAFFADASVDGSTVFFSSADEYVPGVPAGPTRIYAARVGVGTYESPPGQPRCEGEDCKPLPTAPPQLLAPGSLGLFGPGNFTPAPALPPVKPKSKAQLRAEKLAKALKVCRAKRNRHKRRICVSQAGRRYGAKSADTKPKRRSPRRAATEPARPKR